MLHRVLVIGDDLVTTAAWFHRNDEPQFVVDGVRWDESVPAKVRESGAELVIVVGGAAGDCCIPAFTVPVIAVIGSAESSLPDFADDFVTIERAADELRLRALRLLRGSASEVERAAESIGDEMALRQLVGSDPAFLDVLRQIPLYARVDTPVLIAGETGTGKELCARALHHLGPRRNQPFVAVDCGSLPDHLFENEMFGHVRGAYTDAGGDQKGLVALSDHGTLFLDEVDSLSFAAQGKLLRLLQEKTYRPLGGEKFLRADVHVVAATNRDLEDRVRQKQFRADLFYRLNVLQIRMPPLRERRGDIPQLARHFLQPMIERIGARRTLVAATLRKLAGYDWPGNVRELSNLVQRAAVMAQGESILPCHIVLPQTASDNDDAADEPAFQAARRRTLENFERSYVKSLLDKNGWNISRAAREAKYERRALGRLAKKYNLTR